MIRALLAALVVAAALSCAPDDRFYGPYPTENAGNAVGPKDKTAEGQWYFFHETWGAERHNAWPPTDFMLSLMGDPRFGDQFARFGFLHDDADDFPIGFKRGTVDPSGTHETCAACHTAELPDGARWLGAPNTRLDFGGFQAAVNAAWVAAGNAPLEDELADEKNRALGPGRAEAASGSFPHAVPAAYPTYFTLADATALNYMGTGKNVRTEVTFSLYTFGAGDKSDGVDVPFPSDDKLQAFLGFFGNLPSPAPPADAVVDPRVKRGRAVFAEARCDGCHHLGDRARDGVVPTPKHDLRDRLPDDEHPRGTIGTDRAHRVLLDGSDENSSGGGADDGYGDLIWFVISRGLSVDATDGYRVSDLRGLTFSAPYLHNDSVPTLDALFVRQDQRPATFIRDGFLVDTRARGNGNGGHEFGVDLSVNDKAALVAFLKTL